MSREINVVVPYGFSPRSYQLPLFRAMKKGCKRAVCLWHRRCVSGNSRVLMSNGSWKYIKHICEGDKILSWNGNELVEDTVKTTWSSGIKKCRAFGYYGAEKLTATSDHVVMVKEMLRPNKLERTNWKRIGDVKAHEAILVYSGLMFNGTGRTDYGSFLGYMISDGTSCIDQQPKFTTTSKKLFDDICDLASGTFPDISLCINEKGRAWDIRFSNKVCGGTHKNTVKEFLRHHGLVCRKKEKRIPEYIWDSGEDVAISFLSAVFDCDGSIYVQKHGRMANTWISPKAEAKISVGESQELAWDYYYLLKKLGVMCGVVYNDRGHCWTLRIWEAFSVKKLLNMLVLKEKHKSKEAALALNMPERRRKKYKNRLFSSFPKTTGDEEDTETYDIETSTYGNFVCDGVIVHNSGKDLSALNITVQKMCEDVGVYFYVFPTYNQARKVIWDSVTNDGRRIIDYFPKPLIESINHSEMKIRFVNGSLFQLVGSDNFDQLMGTNPKGVVFSEYALQNPMAYEYIRPILTANRGWALFVSTPRGKNHFYDLWKMALKNDDWFTDKVTVDDSGFITEDDIKREIEEGMSEETAFQEFKCSFEKGVEGSYYGKLIDECYKTGRIAKVPYDRAVSVDTFWDLGYGDCTSIIFSQQVGKEIHVIDCYENSGEGLEHYAKVLQEKGYVYGRHFAPFDVEAGNLSTGKSLKSYARELGINFIVVPKQSIEYGIECGRTMFQYCWIDESNCRRLIKCIEHYHKKYNEKMQCYSNVPLHDYSSHFADAWRYMAVAKRAGLGNSSKLTPEKIREMRTKYVA